MTRAAFALALATLPSCAPTPADPPHLEWELVLPSRRLDQLVALPGLTAAAVGRNRDSAGDTWLAITDGSRPAHVRDRDGSRIATTLTHHEQVAVVVDGFESSPSDRARAPLLQFFESAEVVDSRDLSPALPKIDTIAPVGDHDLLLTAFRKDLAVVARDGTTRWTWSHDDVVVATALDDAILAAGHPAGQSHDVAAPIQLWRISLDGTAIDPTTIEIPDRAFILTLVPAGTDAFALAMIYGRDFVVPRTSLVRIRPDATVQELATSEEHPDLAWVRSLAVDPDGGLVAVGGVWGRDTVLVHAFGPDDELRWTLELEQPLVAGAALLSDVCISLDPHIAIASDGGIIVGAYDGCTFSWLRAFDPAD